MYFWILLSELNDAQQEFVGKLYEEYKNVMYKYALLALKNHHDAEDAVDDAMCNIIKYVTKIEGQEISKLGGYVYVTVVNSSRRKLEKRGKIRQNEWPMYIKSETDDGEEYNCFQYESLQDSLEEIIINKENETIVRKALTQLTQDMQEAILLVYFFDFSQEEAANFLHIKQNALRARLHKARKKLKTILENQGVVPNGKQ